MKRTQALKYIRNRLAEGVGRSEVFKELRNQVSFKEDLFSYLAEVPDNSIRKRYRTANILLFVLLVFITVAKIIIGGLVLLNLKPEFIPWLVLKGFWMYIFTPLVLVYFAVSVFKFRGSAYRFFVMLGISYLLLSLSDSKNISSWFVWQIPTFIAIYLAYRIGKNAFPYYGFWGNLKPEILKHDLENNQFKSGAK